MPASTRSIARGDDPPEPPWVGNPNSQSVSGTVKAITSPPAGRNPSAGSSAYNLASIACPVADGGSARSGLPWAIASWSANEVVHALGDRVLHLEPGVELQEVKLAIADQELDCAGVHVADRLG